MRAIFAPVALVAFTIANAAVANQGSLIHKDVCIEADSTGVTPKKENDAHLYSGVVVPYGISCSLSLNGVEKKLTSPLALAIGEGYAVAEIRDGFTGADGTDFKLHVLLFGSGDAADREGAFGVSNILPGHSFSEPGQISSVEFNPTAPLCVTKASYRFQALSIKALKIGEGQFAGFEDASEVDTESCRSEEIRVGDLTGTRRFGCDLKMVGKKLHGLESDVGFSMVGNGAAKNFPDISSVLQAAQVSLSIEGARIGCHVIEVR